MTEAEMIKETEILLVQQTRCRRLAYETLDLKLKRHFLMLADQYQTKIEKLFSEP